MLNWHSGTGKIVYDPYRGNLKKKKHWWCVVEVDREITRYYRWWIQSQLHISGLCQPSWDAHISVLRGEKPREDLMHLWKKYNGQSITFRYKHDPHFIKDRESTGFYWMVDVDCPQLINIRKELQRPSNWQLHLTVGRTWY